MAGAFSKTLFSEDWSEFPLGHLNRDSTARGEYMAMVVPPNPNGWYHNGNMGVRGVPDRNHSAFSVRKRKSGRTVGLPQRGWAPSVILTRGEMPWRDFVVTARVTVKDALPVGLVGRYVTDREHYAAYFESGVFKLARVVEGEAHILDSALFKRTNKPLTVTLKLKGDALIAKAGRVTLSGTDGAIASGGIGLWANGPGEFGKVTVKTTAAELKRMGREAKRGAARIAAKRRKYPEMELVCELDVRGHALGRQIRFADLDGDGRMEILFAIPAFHQGRNWRYTKISQISALDLDGNVLWKRGKIADDSLDITADMPFQAADRGYDGMEVVACFGWSLEVLDPLTGKTKQKVRTPKPPTMEPYWNELSQYWGDGHGDDLPWVIPDAVRLCNFKGRHAYGDLFFKDRYHNLWAVDGKSLKVLWHHAANSGHYPWAADMNGDGVDEVLHGYSRLDSKGNLVGRLFLGDHPDACFSYVDENGLRHNLHPSGEAGLIDECSDGRVTEVHLGHVQHLSVANFIQYRPDLERITVDYHGNEGIIVMMDCDDRVLRKVEKYASGSICQPVNWTGDGRELIAFSPRHGDGGLWDENLDLVVEFPKPDGDRPGKYMEVHDLIGLGVDQLIVWDERRLHVYAPARLPKRRGKRYAPVRPGPNLSNYQVNYSLPRWK